MAKKGIHPDYHEITIQTTDGTKFKTKSCWGKKGDTLKPEVDPKNHPAWQKTSQFVNVENLQVSKFQKKYGDFGSLSEGKKNNKKEEE